MRSILLVLIFVVSFLPASPCPLWALTLDNFTGAQSIEAPPGGAVSSILSTSHAMGGYRELHASADAGGLEPGRLGVSVGGGNLIHSQDATISGSSRLIWDGDGVVSAVPNASGLPGIDFFQDQGSAIQLTVTSFDFPAGIPVNILLTAYDKADASGNTYSSALLTLNAAINSPTDFFIPFASFLVDGPSGGANFHNVGAFSLSILGSQPDVDIFMQRVKTDGICSQVPDSQGRVIDACGVCGGDGSSCADCLGVPNGSALPGTVCSTGQLGICSAGTFNGACVCSADEVPQTELCDALDNNCNGQVDESFPLLGTTCGVGQGVCSFQGLYECAHDGGLRCSADDQQPAVDDCEESKGCDGVPGSGLTIDACGICGGNGTSCLDCAGQAFGIAALDRCGVCQGNGISCLGCESKDLSPTLHAMDNGAKEQERYVLLFTSRLRAAAKTKKIQTYIRKVKKEAHELQIRNWTISWFIPAEHVGCTNTQFCTSYSNQPIIDEYLIHAGRLRDMAVQVAKRLQAVRGQPLTRKEHKVLATAESIYNQNVSLALSVPRSFQICN